MIYADVQNGKVSDFIITLMTQTKAKKSVQDLLRKMVAIGQVSLI